MTLSKCRVTGICSAPVETADCWDASDSGSGSGDSRELREFEDNIHLPADERTHIIDSESDFNKVDFSAFGRRHHVGVENVVLYLETEKHEKDGGNEQLSLGPA